MSDGGGRSLLWRPVARFLALGAKLMGLWSARLSAAAQRVQSRAEGNSGREEPLRPRLPWDGSESEPPARWLERLRRSRVPVRWISHRTPERASHDYAAPTQQDLLPTQDPTAEPPVARESAVAPPESRRPRPLRLRPTTARSAPDETADKAVKPAGTPATEIKKIDDMVDLALKAADGVETEATPTRRVSPAKEPDEIRRPFAEPDVTPSTDMPLEAEPRSQGEPARAQVQQRRAPQQEAALSRSQQALDRERAAFETMPQSGSRRRAASVASPPPGDVSGSKTYPRASSSIDDDAQASRWPELPPSSWEDQSGPPRHVALEEARHELGPSLVEPPPARHRPIQEHSPPLAIMTQAEREPWPALPDEDEPESTSADWESRLRTWRRRQRLEREQRGDPWNESLF